MQKSQMQESGLPEPRLIPHVISKIAKDEPSKIWASVPRSSSQASEGYEDITYARFNYAVTRAAQWMQEVIEPQRNGAHEPLAYIGVPDSRYIIFTVAAIKVGFQMLYLSPRNSTEAQRSVLKQANCSKFLCSSSMEDRVKKLLEVVPDLSDVVPFVVPEQDELLKDEEVPDFPYEQTVEKARTTPLVILHTSSTTGIPKTIPLNQGYGLHEDVLQHVPKHNGLDIITRKPFYGQVRMFVAMPLFHAGGVLLTLLKSIYQDIVAVFQPPAAALSAQVFADILQYGKCNGCVIPPFLLEEMLTNQSHFDLLAGLKFVQFGSGALSKTIGDLLLTRQKNCPHYIGSSECGLYILLELDDPVADWQYFRFHPWSGTDFRPIGDNSETRELFIVRSNAPKVAGLQPVFELFPELDEWPTRDLYVPHPNKPDHWRCIGRNDDVLVLSNGEKLNPVDTEGRIANTHGSVTGALVIGQGQSAAGLLLEVRDVDVEDPAKRAQLIKELWPTIEAANKDAPSHGQLDKELILFTTPDKPFLRTPKLSIRRGPTVDLYAEEIARMYEQQTNGTNGSMDDVQSPADVSSVASLQTFFADVIHSVTHWEPQPERDDDLFMYGMDSLHVARIARKVKSVLSKQSIPVEINIGMIYGNPTIAGLANMVLKQINPKADQNGVQPTKEAAMEGLIQKYSNFDFLSESPAVPPIFDSANGARPLNIILTGSTGSLGTYILLALLENPQVDNVYCLNRPRAKGRLASSLAAQTETDIAHNPEYCKRVHFLYTESLGGENFGLVDSAQYSRLQQAEITHVIHNAWPVNFNIPLESFASHISGVHNLVKFCAGLAPKPKIIFLSSLSSVTSLSKQQQVPETVVADVTAPSPMGYGESKYVAERVLNNATEASQGAIATDILRIGQIAGPVKRNSAAWPAREWLPSLIISSRTLGALPDSLGRMNDIDWVPVDLLAECVTELLRDGEAKVETRTQSNVFHVVNPSSVPWQDLRTAVAAQIGVKNIVSLKDWIEGVREGPDESSELSNPAQKIIKFYEALANQDDKEIAMNEAARQSGQGRFELENMNKVSSTFRKMSPVKKEWMESWIEKWFEA